MSSLPTRWAMRSSGRGGSEEDVHMTDTEKKLLQAQHRLEEALDKGDFILAGIDGDHLLQAVDVAVEMNRNRDLGIPVPDYVDENVSDKVVKIIQSYTGVVNKMVWRKY